MGAGLQIGTLKDAREIVRQKVFEGVQIYDPGAARAPQSPEYESGLFIFGLEDSTEQVSYDIVFVNMLVPKSRLSAVER